MGSPSRIGLAVSQRLWVRITAALCIVTFASAAAAQAPAATAPPAESPPAAAAPAPATPPPAPAPAAAPAPAPAAQPAAPPAATGMPPAPAPAQQAPYGAPPPPAVAQAWTQPLTPIEIHSEKTGLIVELYAPESRPGRDLPVVRCVTPCSAQVYAGEYLLYVESTEDTVSGKKRITISQPSYVIVTPDSSSSRSAGLAIAIVGTVAIPAGLVVLLIGALDEISCADQQEPCGRDLVTPGVLMLLGGLALTPIGWVMFGTSFRPGVEQRPARVVGKVPTETPSWAAALGGPRGSAGLRFSVAF